MNGSQRVVRRILCFSELPDERRLAVTEFTDGRFGIELDFRLLGNCTWPSSQLDPCIDVYLALRRQYSTESAR